MHIIFQPDVNKNPTSQFIAFYFFTLILASVMAQNCKEVVFTTTFTKCQIGLDDCLKTNLPTNTNPTSSYIFKNCTMSQCSRVGAGENCVSYNEIVLDEPSCYKYCCISNIFDKKQCF